MSTKYSVQLQESQQPSCHNPYNVFYDNYLNTNATTECTGLGYRMTHTREEWDACRQVFDFLPVPFLDSEDMKH